VKGEGRGRERERVAVGWDGNWESRWVIERERERWDGEQEAKVSG